MDLGIVRGCFHTPVSELRSDGDHMTGKDKILPGWSSTEKFANLCSRGIEQQDRRGSGSWHYRADRIRWLSPCGLINTKNTSVLLQPWYLGLLLKSPSTRALLTRWGGEIFVFRGCAVHCRMLNSIPGIYPLDARSIHSASCDNYKYLQPLPNICWGIEITPSWEAWCYSNLTSYAKHLCLLTPSRTSPYCEELPLTALSIRNAVTHASSGYLLLNFHVSVSPSLPQDSPWILPLKNAFKVTWSFPKQQYCAYWHIVCHS